MVSARHPADRRGFQERGREKNKSNTSVLNRREKKGGLFSGFGPGVTLGRGGPGAVRASWEARSRKRRKGRILCGSLLRRAKKMSRKPSKKKYRRSRLKQRRVFCFSRSRGMTIRASSRALHGFVRQFNTQNLNSLKPNSIKTTASYAVRFWFVKTRIRWRKRMIYEDYRNISPSNKKVRFEHRRACDHLPLPDRGGFHDRTRKDSVAQRQSAGGRADHRRRMSPDSWNQDHGCAIITIT